MVSIRFLRKLLFFRLFWLSVVLNFSSSSLWVFSDNFVNFNTFSVFLELTLFKSIMLDLFGIEALCLMLFHISRSSNLLDNSNHGFITF